MMMITAGHLINQMSARRLRGMDHAILGQEFKRPVNCRFSEAGQVASGALKDLGRREMPAGMMKHMHDRQTLGSHAKAARAEFRGVKGSAGHRVSYCK